MTEFLCRKKQPLGERVRRSRFFAILVAVVYLGIQFFVPKEIILDWESYGIIYAEDGAWLRDSGLDPLFRLLIAVAKGIGISYDAFRALISILLGVFVYYASERGSRMATPGSALVVGLAVFSIFLIRGTVTIREGLAATLLLIAVYNDFFDRSGSAIGSKILVGILYVSAALVHIGLAPLILVRFVITLAARFGKQKKIILGAIPVAAYLFLTIWVFADIDAIQIFASTRADANNRAANVGALSVEIILFCGVKFAVSLFYIALFRTAEFQSAKNRLILESFLLNNVLLVALPSIAGVLLLSYLSISPVVTVSLVRLFDLSDSLSVFAVAMFARRKLPRFFVVAMYLGTSLLQYFRALTWSI